MKDNMHTDFENNLYTPKEYEESVEKQIDKMQNNLFLFRTLLGWSTEDLARKLCVTRPTICNMEQHKQNMNFCQYVTLRLIFDHAAATQPDNFLFLTVYALTWESKDGLSDAFRQEILQNVSTLLDNQPTIPEEELKLYLYNINLYKKISLNTEIAKKYFDCYDKDYTFPELVTFGNFQSEWLINWLRQKPKQEMTPQEYDQLMQNCYADMITDTEIGIANFIKQGILKVYNGSTATLPMYNLSKYKLPTSELPKSLTGGPELIISQHSELDVVKRKQFVNGKYEEYYVPEIADNFFMYDIVIVSMEYIQKVEEQNLLSPSMYDDFKDRLYVGSPIEKNNEVIGIKSFRKVYPCKTLNEYFTDLQLSARPSLMSIAICLEKNANVTSAIPLTHKMNLQNLLRPYVQSRLQEAKPLDNKI